MCACDEASACEAVGCVVGLLWLFVSAFGVCVGGPAGCDVVEDGGVGEDAVEEFVELAEFVGGWVVGEEVAVEAAGVSVVLALWC